MAFNIKDHRFNVRSSNKNTVRKSTVVLPYLFLNDIKIKLLRDINLFSPSVFNVTSL